MDTQSKMESQTRPAGFDGTQVVPTGVGNAEAATPAAPLRLPGYILRIAAVVLTLLSTIVMGAAKQSGTFEGIDPNSGELVVFSASVKSSYSAAFVYFVIVNAFAFVYSSVSLAISVATRGRPTNLGLTIADLIMVAFLYSSNGAATAINLVAERGQSKLAWGKFCDVAGKFCSQVKGAIALSNLAALAYLIIVMLVIIGLHRRS